ncbi:MAG TPA: hypothetical protein VK857_10215, partial [Desulforhopalus sp.]|nr:hypothetical protein [Desulforhopalus sp.]
RCSDYLAGVVGIGMAPADPLATLLARQRQLLPPGDHHCRPAPPPGRLLCKKAGWERQYPRCHPSVIDNR